MATSPDSKTDMADTTQQHVNMQQVGYPNYGSQQPTVIVTNPPPPAYNHPVPNNVQYGYQTPEQSCCQPSQETAVDIESAATGQLEDFFEMKPHLKVDFNGVFQEPKDAGGVSFVTTYNTTIYYWTKRCLYIFLVCILGPIMAFSFGLVFALMDFLSIWCVNPSVRLLHIMLRFTSNAYRPLTRILLDPIFESFGQVYRVRNSGVFTERKYKLDVTGITLGGGGESEHQHTS
ncbi:putative caveolin-1 [Apostichopus japonicus]|uniref:Caveolin n=1 Tax=Stichopus japonicus TaxID=307972 RepID=A0A2G8LA06_STIJA|nr:putative caveolin-1 [Apostichopus japonicus]